MQKLADFLSSDKIDRQNRPILSFACHRLYLLSPTPDNAKLNLNPVTKLCRLNRPALLHYADELLAVTLAVIFIFIQCVCVCLCVWLNGGVF